MIQLPSNSTNVYRLVNGEGDKLSGLIIDILDSVESGVSATHEQTILENGLKYRINPHSDQKTGFYCDQRENRLLVKGLVKDKTVLDTYCYTGGFALNALDALASKQAGRSVTVLS
eukprot:gene30516-37748_t